MHSLEQALYEHELIVLRTLGEWLDVDLTGADKKASVAALVEAFANVNLALEIDFLPPEEKAALTALLRAGGRLPVATFSRDHGQVRLMGPGRLEREEPWYDPISPAEALWYRGFLYRGFDKTPEGMIEFYYLPDEFMAQFPEPPPAASPGAASSVPESGAAPDGNKAADAEPVASAASDQPPRLEDLPISKGMPGRKGPAAGKRPPPTPATAPASAEVAPTAAKVAPAPTEAVPARSDVPPTRAEVMPAQSEVPPTPAKEPPAPAKVPPTPPEVTPASSAATAVRADVPPTSARAVDPAPPVKRATNAAPLPAAGLTAAAAPDRHRPAPLDAIDDLTTLLGLAQAGVVREGELPNLQPFLRQPDLERAGLLVQLAWEMRLLRRTDDGVRPARAAVDWLKETRAAQLQALAEAWSQSAWNDLCHTPGLACEGSGWENDPILARAGLLDSLPRQADWYNLDDLVAFIKIETPDFQRPDGDYDAWYIRDIEQDVYVRGFAGWDLVEGRLLRFLVRGPLHWLGLADVGAGHFRLTARGLGWLTKGVVAEPEVEATITVGADGILTAPSAANRYQRFQVTRFADALPVTGGEPYQYQITPASLARADAQAIDPERVITFLTKLEDKAVPAGLRRAIERWQEKGTEARLATSVVLQVSEQAILDILRSNPRTRDYIGASLGELAALVRWDDWQPLCRAAASLGLLLAADIGKP